MEFQQSSQSNALPNAQVPPLPNPISHSAGYPPLRWPMAYQQYPFCGYPKPYLPSPSSNDRSPQHWVYPYCIHGHASSLVPPPCHGCSKIWNSPCRASSTTSGLVRPEAASPSSSCPQRAVGNPRNTLQLSSANVSDGSLASTSVPCGSAVKQDMPAREGPSEVKCTPLQPPMAMHPARHPPVFHPPLCCHSPFITYPCPHGYWYPPCLLCMSPATAFPMAGPLPFPFMPPLPTTNCNHIGPELNTPETLSTNCANGETSLYSENWQGKVEMDFQDFRDREVETTGELEDGDDEPIFVLTDEYAEFFAKSEARRQAKKRQQRKEAKNLCRAAKFVSEKRDDETGNSPS